MSIPPHDPRNDLGPYVEMVGAYVEGELGAEEFAQRYSDAYLSDDTAWSDEEFDVLDSLFADTDFYEPDPTVRAEVEHTIDEGVLRARAAQALTRLRELAGGR